jgi:hypothetical protein
MTDTGLAGDEWSEGITDTDDEPIDGLGELPDCDDDLEGCAIVGPGDGGE